MDPNKLVSVWGSVKAAADAIGVTDKAVYQWISAGRVPKLRVYQIRALIEKKRGKP